MSEIELLKKKIEQAEALKSFWPLIPYSHALFSWQHRHKENAIQVASVVSHMLGLRVTAGTLPEDPADTALRKAGYPVTRKNYHNFCKTPEQCKSADDYLKKKLRLMVVRTLQKKLAEGQTLIPYEQS